MAIEFGLRITGLQTVKPNPPKIYQTSEDPRISFELIPNLKNEKAYRSRINTDENGFRLNGDSQLNAQRSKLIAVLGDSITFGYGVKDNETLPARIEARLPNYQVLNAAVPAYQLLQETAVYEENVAPLQPDIVILVFYFNDFTSKTAWLDDMGIIRGEDWVPGKEVCQAINRGLLKLLPGKCWLDTHSAFYKALKKLVNIRYMNDQLEESREKSREEPEKDTVTEEQLAMYADQLDELVALLDEVPRLFVIWPDRYLHEPSRPKIRALAEARGFVVLDLYDTFSNDAETLGWDTVHPSAKTLDKAAALVVQTLQNYDLLKQ